MPTVRLLTPAVVDGVQHQVYDEVEVSEEDAETLYQRGWGTILTTPVAKQVPYQRKPVATLVPDPNKDKE